MATLMASTSSMFVTQANAVAQITSESDPIAWITGRVWSCLCIKYFLTAYAYEVSQCEPRVAMLLRTPTTSLWCVPKDLRNAQLCL